MNQTLKLIISLIDRQEVVISEHGYDELSSDSITVRDVIQGIRNASVIEDYPDYHKGPCILVLQKDYEGKPIHAVWGVPKNASSPAVLITAYRPDAQRWPDDFRRRKL